MDYRDLTVRYTNLKDAELLQIARDYESLTKAAQTALRAEFAKRGLEPPLLGEELTPANLVTVERYRDLSEAIVARSYLESAGIRVSLYDENLVRLDWQVSNFIGGIRLKVEAADEADARELLSQSVPDSIEFTAGEAFEQPQCPVCGSKEITFRGSSRKAAIASLYLLSVPLPLGDKTWICDVCQTRWKDSEDAP